MNIDLANYVRNNLAGDRENRDFIYNTVRQSLTALAWYHKQGDNVAFDKAVEKLSIKIVDPATLPEGYFSFKPYEKAQ